MTNRENLIQNTNETQFGRDPDPQGVNNIQRDQEMIEKSQEKESIIGKPQFDYANSSSVAKAIKGLALI